MRRSIALAISTVLALPLSACGGGGSGGGTPPVTPTATPPPGLSASAFICPSSSTTFAQGRAPVSALSVVRRPVRRPSGAQATSMLAVRYVPSSATEAAIAARTAAIPASHVATLKFDALGEHVRVFHVAPAQLSTLRASLENVPGVAGVSVVHRVVPQGVTGEYLTSDPYFRGTPGSVAPLYQTAATPGQWDMHIIGLGYAFAYAQPNNGSGITNAGAMGSSSVRLAVIDTGEDVTQPELAGAHVVRTACFITNADGTQQSTGSYVTDPDGHGTDVTGIAAAATNNGFGFAGSGGRISLMLYRVFPTPDDTCATDPTTTDPQCGTSTLDIASAINDAVANGANVINLSLGAATATCTSGVDPDQTEGAAIANALAHNVIVVAASGNGSASTLDPPACDSGVIAVGASAYNDGLPNGSGYTGSNREYVASYSNYESGTAWGIVAPGGDATPNDTDNLHWIENIWTSTPFDSNFAGGCGTDAFGETNDCRILIAGTSMATPHVAGAAALVLSVNAAYQNPASMKQLLCSTADNIGDPHQGCGRLNIYRAMAKALNDPNLP